MRNYTVRVRTCRNHCQHWDLHPELLISTLMWFNPLQCDLRNTETVPKISPICCLLWGLSMAGVSSQENMHIVTEEKHGVIWRGNWSEGCHRKQELFVSPVQLDPETDWPAWKCQAPGPWMQGRREAKGVPEEEVRKKELGKGLVAAKHLYCTYSSTVNP